MSDKGYDYCMRGLASILGGMLFLFIVVMFWTAAPEQAGGPIWLVGCVLSWFILGRAMREGDS